MKNEIIEKLECASDILIGLLNNEFESLPKTEWKKLDTIVGKLENLKFSIAQRKDNK